MKNRLKNKSNKSEQLPEKHKQAGITVPQKETSHLNTVLTNEIANDLPGILVISSYPPKECGVATYTQDLVKQLNNKFINSFTISLCPLESGIEKFTYPDGALYTINTDDTEYAGLAATINGNDEIKMVLVQHEFGFF